MDVFCGIDWAEDHHDIALVDRDGTLLARRRISDDAAGLAQLLGLLAEHGDSAGDPIPVAIETPRGLLTACLRATGPGGCAASTPKQPDCGKPSPLSRCASCRSSSRRWAARPSPCSASSTPPAPPQTTSSKPRSSLLTSTRTPGSSPASQGSARSPAPGYSPRPVTTDPASPMLKDSRPMPGPRPSPAPPARPPRCCTAGSRTSGLAPPATPR